MSNQNLQQQQQQYMQQQQQQQAQASYGYGYSQSQLYPYNPYGHPTWDPLQRMEGPSFTGEASIFQRRYGRESESPSRTSRYGDNSRRSRSRSRSRGRDEDSSDPSQKRLKDTLKRLRQLEEQHLMQDHLLKDMRLSMEDTGRGRSSDSYYDRYGYSSSSSRYSSSSMMPSSYTSSSSSRPGGSSYDSGVMCFKCNKKGHFAKYCTVEDKLCYVCNKSGHISKECPMGPSRPDPDKSCYTCGKKGHLAAHCPQNADKSCYTCGKKGHIAADCTLGTEKHCYTCGKKGHIAADCMTDRCFKCEKSGHRAADCPLVKKLIEGKVPRGGDQKCLKCGGYGHKIKMCPSMGSFDEKRKCHYCHGVGHIARHCISPGVITKPDEEKPKSGKIDAETKYMAEEIVKYANTSYPVREGSKTRKEIDKALKDMGTRHRIMEKELPPAPNKNETTISSQLAILGKLKWKDMIYDKLVDDVYCFICQRSFPSEKYYQEHVTSKEHLTYLAAVQGAKAGWAVRTKLLKKICALPSIFVGDDDGGDDDDDKTEKTSSGEENERQAIKPDLYSTDAKDVKYFVCRVCHSWGETPLQDHFDSDKHKFLYENQWKCDDCNAYFRAYSDYTQHNESQLHRQVLVKTGKLSEDSDEEPSSTKKRSLDYSSDEHSGAKKKRYSLGNDKEDDALGLQFLLPVTGFYCKLCQKFYNEAKVSEGDHCKAQMHQTKLQLWQAENKVEALKKGLAASGAIGKGVESQETKETEKENQNGEENDREGSVRAEVVQQGQETEDVDVEEDVGTATSGNTEEWKMDVEGDPDEHESPPGEDGNEVQHGSEPLEAEVSSDDEEDDETIRATRRGRVTRSAKGQSPKGGKKRPKKL